MHYASAALASPIDETRYPLGLDGLELWLNVAITMQSLDRSEPGTSRFVSP